MTNASVTNSFKSRTKTTTKTMVSIASRVRSGGWACFFVLWSVDESSVAVMESSVNPALAGGIDAASYSLEPGRECSVQPR